MRKGILVLLFLAVLTACGSSKSGITPDDLAIVKVDDKNAVVKYGMSRANVEKVLGEAERDGLGNMMFYADGVSVIFRDNVLVAIHLSEDSKGKYKTVGGAEVNMNKNDFKKIYGDDNSIEAPNNLDYLYDSENKEYLTEMKPDQENTKNRKYLISVTFNDNAEANRILVSDVNAALLAK
ncbi:hypothetical protein [Paenibacillus camerounensis]|uniref:hypothetical protein n=1 Tax=Paenibacillus camerounensis TaxID=1243663 RepID=UPI0005A7A047|nr:hypothetical protein [Paenibacillus camerounensis]